MKPLTILLTGIGAPGTPGTAYSLRNNPDRREVRIVGVDADAECLNQHLVDSFCAVTTPGQGYLADIEAIAEYVDVILPQTTTEARWYRGWDTIKAAHPVSQRGSKYLTFDKWWLYRATEKMYIPRPNTMLCRTLAEVEDACHALGYYKHNSAVVIKPPNESGSRGVDVLQYGKRWTGREKPGTRPLPLEIWARHTPKDSFPWIVQQYLPGAEYTVDCFRGERGFIAIPRLRAKTRGGITTRAETIIHTEKGRQLAEWCRIMSDAFDLRYAFGFQFRESAKGTPRLLECNARIQGTMVAATHAGFNMIYASVKEAMGEPVTVPQMESLEDVVYERVWDGVAHKREEAIA